jgi:hypothetical protein
VVCELIFKLLVLGLPSSLAALVLFVISAVAPINTVAEVGRGYLVRWLSPVQLTWTCCLRPLLRWFWRFDVTGLVCTASITGSVRRRLAFADETVLSRTARAKAADQGPVSPAAKPSLCRWKAMIEPATDEVGIVVQDDDVLGLGRSRDPAPCGRSSSSC